MNAEDLIEKLADAVLARIKPVIKPAVPLDIALWDVTDIGTYLKVAPNKVVERYASLKDFPRPIRIPTAENRTTHARWLAREVIRFVEGHAG